MENTYLSKHTPDTYSIREWAVAEYPSDPTAMEAKWTRVVLPSLKNSSNSEKVSAYNRLAKTRQKERTKIFQDAFEDVSI